MKINFKKIASVLATTAMLGSTIAFASAALSLPASDNVVVYGNALDSAAAVNMASVLVSAAGVTTIAGDNIKLEKSSNNYNLGDAMNAFYPTLDEDELTKVLAAGVYMDDANNEYDFEQAITLGNANLTHFQSSDFNDDKPVIGFNLADGYSVLNYTLDFTPDALKRGLLETTEMTMLGTEYYVLTETNATGNGIKLTLLDNANSAIVSEGTAKTITVGDKSYSLNIVFIDADEVILEVDGVKTNKLTEGGVFKVATDTYVAIKSVLYNAKESGTSQVEVSIGSGKIILENGQEVQMNDKPISDTTDMILTAHFTNSTTEISKVRLDWTLDDDFFIATGTELVLPGFKTIKVSMGGFTMPKEEVTSLKASSDEIFKVKTTIKDGELDLPILYNNDTVILGLGEKVKHELITSSGNTGTAIILNETANSYFVVTYIDGDDAETYAYELDSITSNEGKNSTTLKNLAGGSDVVFSEVGKDKDIGDGNINLVLTTADQDDKNVTITLSETGAGTLYLDRVVTKEGLMFRLPIINATTLNPTVEGHIGLNASAGNWTASWAMSFVEEDKDGNIGSAALGKAFNVTITPNADDGLEPTTVTGISTYETEDGSKKYVGYKVSDLATKVMWDKPTSGLKSLDITYAGAESSAAVYVSEAAAVVSSTGSVAPVMASALTAADKAKNLIVVGGSCVNTVAAKLLTGAETPVCGAAFSALTNVGAGQYMIKGFTSPYADDKIAVLVAGYEQAQTLDAVTATKALTSLTKTTNVVGPTLA